MPEYQHLPLVRLHNNLPRRKHGRVPTPPTRGSGHGARIRQEADAALQNHRAQELPPRFVNPALILRVEMSGVTMEEDWRGLGLTVLSTGDDNSLVLFSSTDDLHDFWARLEEYEGPIPVNQQNRRYSGFIDRIDEIGVITSRDRLGVRARKAGFSELDRFEDDQEYVVDVELWEFGPQDARREFGDKIVEWVEEQGGEFFDHYCGPSISIIRIRAGGQIVRTILAIKEVAFVDFPPQPDIETEAPETFSVDGLPPVATPDDDLPVVAILDSGVNENPLLSKVILAHETYAPEIGEADVVGHGTAVAGVTCYGDLRHQIDQYELVPAARIVSAKIVTDQSRFLERHTLPTQMRTTITRIREAHDCRIFVLSLGDTTARIEQGRVGPWATTLDELARELDVLIFVSAGNRNPRGGDNLEQGVTQYPNYLLEDENRICEPAGAVNVLTVGSLTQSNGLGPEHESNTHMLRITEPGEPSPFTRTGPGGGGVTKPDFVDFGGTMVFDAVARKLQTAPFLPNAGVLTTEADFQRQLLVSKTGTSFSAPNLARKAAQVLSQYKSASANLVKALMANSARIPSVLEHRFGAMTEADRYRIHGIGVVNSLTASFSDDHRVVLYAEDSLGIDQFAVYQVPIPVEFQVNGPRWIHVSLAFDPPVRRTRAEYVGTRMNFRLIRGQSAGDVFEHFRSHSGEDTEAPGIANRYKCNLAPGPQRRDRNTVQNGSLKFTQDTSRYGEEYFLVVRCIGGWASELEISQRYAIVVELEHESQVDLYARVQQRVRIQT